MTRVSFLHIAFLLLTFPSLAFGSPEKGEETEGPPGGDFTLTGAAGPVSLQVLRGKVVTLYFGYTHCPDICPTSLGVLSGALNRLDEAEMAGVVPIFISLDPARDTPAHLADYVRYFHASMLGITGSEEEIAQVAGLYGVNYYRVDLEGSAAGYAINHSGATYLIDQDGTLRFAFPHATPAKMILEAMRYLLAGG